MLKILGVAVLGIVCFLAALIIPMAVTGQLDKVTLSLFFGDEETSATVKAGEDDVGPVAAKLSAELKRVQEWDAKLSEKAALLTQREDILDETLTQITQIQTQIAAAMDALDTEQQAAIQSIAKTMEAMTPLNAATDLQAMSPEDAARILPLVKDRNRGKILDAMAADNRSLILQVLQERKY
ncbi:MAG: hypothetical protein QGD90_00665 [Candidatus Hydrogenedentes bacterium]|nr:hypothetical protein [Candidatus Hydrogenedentota bacterium]